MEENEVVELKTIEAKENYIYDSLSQSALVSGVLFLVLSCLGWAIISPVPKIVFGIHLIIASVVVFIFLIVCLHELIVSNRK
jgi:hypothetical protein